MKKTVLTYSQSSLLTKAFLDKLFPIPKNNQIKIDNTITGDRCILYIDDKYYKALNEAIKENYKNGSFAESNSNELWASFMLAIDTVENAKTETKDLGDFFIFEEIKEEFPDYIKLDKILQFDSQLKEGR